MKKAGRSLTVVVTGGIVAALLAVSFVSFFYNKRYLTTSVIADDVKKIAAIFKTINDTCGIMSVDVPRSPVNFLNVGSFAGSEVGSINLVHPDKWQGPYLNDNPSVQGIEYMLVRTKNGLFVTPGEGVKLPNGKVIGKDIMFDEDSDIQAMASDPAMLLYNGQPLAAKVDMGSGAELAAEVAAVEAEG